MSQLGWPSLGLLIVLAQQLSQVSNNLWLGGDMYEGTNWCGFGERVEELGELQGLDSCCRDLAHCNQTIRPGHEDYGIDNPGLDPMYHCSCTSVFYKCLKIQSTNAPTIREREAAESVGDMFFNFEPRKCLKFEKPILGCDRYPLVDKCKQYKLNKEGKKLWQLFDTQLF